MEPTNGSVAEDGQTEELQQDRLWFLEGMDRVNRAIQDTNDLQQATRVLDAVSSIFGCDRAWLVYPCDPDSKTLRTVADWARPAFAHSALVGVDVPMDATVASVHRLVGSSQGAVCFEKETNEAISDYGTERLGVRSQICLAIHPKIDKPYLLGLDQCTHARNWTQQEQRLFEAIGQRIATLLTSLLLSRDLQESKARLEEAQRVAHVGYWEWDLETGEVVWSDETYRIFGLNPQERRMDIAMVREMVHPEDRDALYSGVDVELEAGVHPIAEFRVVTPNGKVRTVHAITSKLWGAMPGNRANEASGKARRLFGTVQDVTELKRTEEERQALSRNLEESKGRLEEAERVAHLGYWIWDLQTNRAIFSNETCRIYGLKPQDNPIDLAIIRELIHPEDREYVFRNAERAVRYGVHIETEHRLIRPNGEVRIVYSPGDLKRNASGQPYQMVGTCQDITDRKRAEEALQRSQLYLSEGQRLAHMGSWALNENGFDYWSSELFQIHRL